MAVGEHEAVAVGPARIGRVVAQVPAPERDRDLGHAHGRAGMAGVGLLHRVHRERADRVGHQRRALRVAPPASAIVVSGESIAAIGRELPCAGEPAILRAGPRPSPDRIIAPMQGLHLTADLARLRRRPARDDRDGEPAPTAAWPRSRGAGLTPVGELFHRFVPTRGAPASRRAASPASSCSPKSHLAVHTWPELEAATLDVYVCNLGADNSARAEALMDALVGGVRPGPHRAPRAASRPMKAIVLAAGRGSGCGRCPTPRPSRCSRCTASR